MFFLNCTNGQLYVGTKNLTDGEMIPCVPNALISSVPDSRSSQQQDAMLLWLEEHGRRLENGIIKLREEGKFRSISLFPEELPLCSTAVTNGVKVRASAVFVPEMSDLQHESDKYWFAYSIRMSLLPEGCIINGMFFSSCQLYWRHWIIRANDVVEADVDGEAVIGKFPLLRPGEREFVYESCTPLPSSLGSVEGAFTFVPGRLEDPKGSPFEVEVARFPLPLPDYIF
uniref:Putative F-box protein SKIP16 n=2 Tax=Davidia involucrata TaxID=16924 RepID=A0A5B7AWT6_DAVIN